MFGDDCVNYCIRSDGVITINVISDCDRLMSEYKCNNNNNNRQ